MIALKDTNALNVFTNGSAGGGVAGYYSRRGDYVFILNSYANGGSTTITHELGHFFTLPHTFYGWEGTNARALYNSVPAPDSILDSHGEKKEVEFVARTGPLAIATVLRMGFVILLPIIFQKGHNVLCPEQLLTLRELL